MSYITGKSTVTSDDGEEGGGGGGIEGVKGVGGIELTKISVQTGTDYDTYDHDDQIRGSSSFGGANTRAHATRSTKITKPTLCSQFTARVWCLCVCVSVCLCV